MKRLNIFTQNAGSPRNPPLVDGSGESLAGENEDGDTKPAPLRRTFSELSASDTNDGPTAALKAMRTVEGPLQDWDWLHEVPVSVIIADGGAGKTYELTAQRKRLREQGRAAFFVAIERLCQTDLRGALPSEEEAGLFERWRRGDAAATFFLDSVDEAKLPTAAGINPLQRALRRLEEALGDRIGSCRLIISSRPSAWSPAVEFKEVQRVAQRLRTTAATAAPPVRVVKLDHLDEGQIDQLARSRGAGAEFLELIRDTGAIEFAQYPLDVIDQVDAYKEAVRSGEPIRAPFRSLTAILDRAIARRAHEFSSSTPRNSLDPERVMSGAKRLALSLMLQQTRVVRLPGHGGEGLDPLAALQGARHSWSRQEVESLLATGLFEPAWQGASRFHHRRTQERLAALAIWDLRNAGCSAQAALDLLLPPSFDVRTTPAPYVDAAGWLCALDADFASLVVRVAPELLMEHGDPGALPLLLRVEAVRTHAERYRSQARRGDWFDTTLFGRFADAGLTEVLAQTLKAKLPDEPRSHALLMARAGKLSNLSDVVLAIAVDPGESAELRSYAVLALSDIASLDQKRALSESVRRSRSTAIRSRSDDVRYARTERNRLKVWTVDACFPTAMGTVELLDIIRSLEPRNPENIDELGRILRRAIAPNLLKAELIPFAQAVSAVSWSRTGWRLGTFDLASWSELGWHLLPVLHDVVVRILRDCTEAAEQDWLVKEVDRLWSAGKVTLGPLNTAHKLDAETLADAVRSNPQFRRHFFWCVAAAQDAHAGVHALHRLQKVYRGRAAAAAATRAADLHWLQDDLFKAEATRRPLALDAVSNLLSGQVLGRRRTTAALIFRAIREGRPEVVQRLRWRPLQRLWWRLKYRRELRKDFWKFRWLRWRRESWPLLKLRAQLLIHRSNLRAGFRPDLVWEAAFSRGGDDPFGQVAKRLGERRADDLRVAARAFVRRDPVPEQRVWDAALARQGWRLMAAEQPDQLAQISDGALRVLIRSSLREHEWPAYAVGIAQRPDVWREVAEPRVRADLARRGALTENVGWTLQKVAYGDVALQRPLAAAAVQALSGLRAPSADQITNVARVAASEEGTKLDFAELALRRASEHFAEGRVETGGVWWTEAFKAEPLGAWSSLKRWRVMMWSSAPALVYPLYAALAEAIGRFASRAAGEPELPPDLLAELAVLGRQVVEPSADERLNGWVSPRHHAQDLRDSALQQLAETPTAGARQALRGLLALPEFADATDWIAILLRRQAERAARPQPWSPSQVQEYCRVWARAPRTTGELYALLIELIRAIELDLKTSEFDRRAAFRGMSERTLRSWIGEELRRRSNGWFSVTQETVTAGEKRMDLRCEAAGGDAICVIELKIAGASWPKLTLFEHLETQLADQYLISRRVRSGIYLVADLGRKAKFDTPGGSADFDGLVAALQLFGEEVRAARPKIEDLGVMSFVVDVPAVSKRRSAAAAKTLKTT